MSRFTGPLRQVGLVVRDARATMLHWAEHMGVGPFVLFPGLEFENFRYLGQPSPPPVLDIAFAQSGSLQIEVIQQLNDAPSGYRDFLNTGQEGLQHMCAMYAAAQPYDDAYRRLRENAYAVVHEGNAKGSPERFAYFSPRSDMRTPLLEISEGLAPGLAPLWARLEAISANWDGSDPIRDIGSLI
jgi:hypothetical protein